MKNDKKKIILIRPFYKEKVKQQSFPLGLGYLASVLEKEGYCVSIYDLNIIGLTHSRFLKFIEKKKIDFIGVSGLTYDFPGMIDICNLIKKNDKFNNIPLIIGGIHVSSLPEYSLRKTKADFAVIGEGEKTIVELLNSLIEKSTLFNIKGIGYFELDKYVQTELRPLIENLDLIPFPSWHLFNIKLYTQPHGGFLKEFPYFPIFTSRGCPYKCIFCASKNFWKQRIRFRSVKNVVDEIEFLIENYGAKEIQIWDDNFTLNRKYVLEFAKEIKLRGIDVFFSCPNGVRIDTLDKKLLEIMKSIGFYSLIFAVETGSKKIQKIIKKHLNLDIVKPIIKEAKDLGYYNRAFFIIGLPSEKIDDVYRTFKFALDLKLDSANFFIFTPLPGSSFFKDWIKNKNLENIKWNYEFFSNPQSMVGFNYISKKQILKLQRYIYIRFYIMRPWILIPHIFRYKISQYTQLLDRLVYLLQSFVLNK